MVTLALGIGASTAIFSVIDNVLLDPFPYEDSSRYVVLEIHDTDQSGSGYKGGFTGPELLTYMTQNHVFDRAIANDYTDVLYSRGEGTEQYRGGLISPGTFEFFGMPALLGRVLRPADYLPNAPPTFVLRYKTWKAHFSGEPDIIGKTFVLNGTARTLVGIMPPRFAWGDSDLWIPQTPSNAIETGDAHDFRKHWYLLGHLKRGVTIQRAEADFEVIARNVAKQYPDEYPRHFKVKVETLADQVVGDFRSTLFIVMAAVGLLLLIACGNVANLLMARATTRQKDFGIRAALGASRWRLARQLLVESLALALGGAALGGLLAWSLLKALIALTPPDIIPAEAEIHMNSPVLMFALGVAALTALIFGLAPALQATRRDVHDSLRDSGKGTGGGRGSNRMRNIVVVGEVALSLTLLVAAGLLMRSFIALHQVHMGLRPDHILTARLPLPADRYRTATQVTGFFRPLLTRLKALPGIVDATETSTLPPYGGIPTQIEIVGKTHSEAWRALFQLCSEGYFNVLRIELLQGRLLTEADVAGARKLAVINQTLARKYFGEENSIGQQIRLNNLENFPDPVKDPWFEVIGVVADVKNRGLQEPIQPEVWVPYNVTASTARGVLIRTAGEPLAMLPVVQQEIWNTDKGVAVTMTGSLEGFINSFSYAPPRFGFALITVFATIGMILVTIGVYSVVAYSTARRTHEIGIRMALGAASGEVRGLVIRAGLKLILLGIVIGLTASLAISRVLASELWGVSARDPLTLVVVPILLLVIGLLACWIPARRATRVSPVVALRYE
jgi:putative ABC transport system permease protein